jgi:hypothetical protein
VSAPAGDSIHPPPVTKPAVGSYTTTYPVASSALERVSLLPPLSVTVAVIVYTPACVYVTVAVAEPPATVPVAVVPLSRSKLAVCVSPAPTSVKLALNVIGVPTATGPDGSVTDVITGAVLITVTVVVASLVAPLLSVTTSVTWYVPSSVYVCRGFWVVSDSPSPKLQV